MPSPAPFAEWTLRDCQAAVDDAISATFPAEQRTTAAGPFPFGVDETDGGFAEAKDFARGRFWRGGRGWCGPGRDAMGTLAPEVAGAIERQFTPVDACGEVLDTVVNAFGVEAAVSFAALEPAEDGTPEAEKQRDEQDALLRAVSAWWDRVGLWGHVRRAVRQSRAFARGPLRVWLPASQLAGDALPAGLAFDEALARLELASPDADAAVTFRHPVTRQWGAVVLYRREETDVGAATGPGLVDGAELWYVDAATGVTRIRTVETGAADRNGVRRSSAEDFAVDLGGRLPVAEVAGDLLLTDPVRRQQRRLNYYESLLNRILEVSGWAERYLIDAAPNGTWRDSDPGYLTETQTRDGVVYYLHETPRTLGSATTNELHGVPVTNAAGEIVGTTTPQVFIKEPTDPEYAIKAAEHARRTILQDCRQGHLAGGGTAEASGDAYEQRRAAFAADLEQTRAALDTALRSVIEAALAWAGGMSGGDPLATALERHRVVVTSRYSAGPVRSETVARLDASVQAGTLSLASALSARGIEDVDAETQAIQAQPGAKLAVLTKQGEALAAWLAVPGARADVAAEVVAGLRELDAETIRALFTVPTEGVEQ